jgi:hypothetical protein
MTKTTTATIRRRRPPHMMLVFSRFSPKKVPFEDTTEAVVALAVGRWDGGRGRPRRRGRPPRSAPWWISGGTMPRRCNVPVTHLPFLFHQNRSPLTSYPSIVIKMPFSVSDRSYADVVSLSAGSPHARPQITPSSNLDNDKLKSTPTRQSCPTSRLRDRHKVCTSSAISVMTWWESA